ncbi:MAG: B12-binding domain-containing radical SAM protein [Myxococcaceae bacterium]|nr:B12-binding domain-containing radical SAM protein [Myxococcaceae bacterium]
MTRKRLKLITLPWELEVPTLGLASLAAVTPRQFDVAIIDLLRERLHLDEPTDLVGISASTPRINAAYALADLYRRRGVTVVIGGHHATSMPDEALEHADAVVVGEGETSWRRLCEDFLVSPSKVHGLYRDPAPDLSTLPQPRVDLMHLERYGSWYYPLIASRGCPEACSFCFAKRMTLGYRTYPISHVLEQVRRRPAWVKGCYFVDDNLTADVDYARELFRALEKFGLTFGMQSRHEFSRSGEDLDRARRAGCILVSCGYESVNQHTLDGTGKRAAAEVYRETAAAQYAAGLIPSGNWMFGFDWDEPDIFARTLDFLDSTRMLHCSFTTEIPFPGTQAWKSYRADGRLMTEDYDEYVGKDHVLVRPAKMTPAQLRDGIRWLATSYYSVGRSARRAALAVKNPKLAPIGRARLPALYGLQAYQMWQWRYRMVPSLQWLYSRLLSVNKHLYVRDALRRTNFWKSEHQRAGGPTDGAVSLSGPFVSTQGHKPSPKRPLAPSHAEVRNPSR